MKLKYAVRSSFVEPCEDAIRDNLDALTHGQPCRVELEPRDKGYQDCVVVAISVGDDVYFETDWSQSDPSRFPARLKAAATALHNCSCFGRFRVSHSGGIVEITKV